MRSFSLIRTNPKLTTNIKLVVDSEYNLYLESFNSTTELSKDKYKKVQVSEKNFYDELIPYFYKNTSASNAYSIKYDNDNTSLLKEYDNQLDDIYLSGCSKIEDLNYQEEFESFAPLHIDKNYIPKNYIIFRVDNAGILNLTKENFKAEIIDKLKCVKTFDLSEKTPIGKFIKNNYIDNESIPKTPFEFDARRGEFSKWNGIEFTSGGYTSKSLFIEDWLEKEKNFFDFDEYITSNYETLKVVYPNILNLKFLFNDTPGDRESLKTWSINRYFGFYIDELECVSKYTFYSPPELESGIKINSNNVFVDGSNNKIKPIVKDWVDTKSYYVEYLGDFYQIKRFEDSQGVNGYKILSDTNLENKEALLNKNVITFSDNNVIEYNSKYNSGTFDIPNFGTADVWLININAENYVIKKNTDGNFYIQSDHVFEINKTNLEFFINESDDSYRTKINLENFNDSKAPMNVKICKVNFTDIKDFELSMINTEWSDYSYSIEGELSKTDEPKMYKTNYTDNSNPKAPSEYVYDEELINIPTTSEYVATSEVFEIEDNELSPIWRKNSLFTKWGFKNSNSINDTTYRLNNNAMGEVFNREPNTQFSKPNRTERNLDYFYTFNPDSNDYINSHLNIKKFLNNYSTLDTNITFDIHDYINSSISDNYFKHLFSEKEITKNGDIIRYSNKYSTFNIGDNVETNQTLFKNIKFSIYNIDKIDINQNNYIENVTVEPTNEFDDYELSILLSENEIKLEPNSEENAISNFVWKIISKWELGEQYIQNDIVYLYDVLYICLNDNIIESPNDNPSVSSDWQVYNAISTVLWNPLSSYTDSDDFVFNLGEYYIYNNTGNIDFWNNGVTYSVNDTVIYDKEVYTATTNNISTPPIMNGHLSSKWEVSDTTTYTNSDLFWLYVNGWNNSSNYSTNEYVVYQEILFRKLTTNNMPNVNPIDSTDWELIYNINDSNDIVYGTTISGNNIHFNNNHYYLCMANPDSETLDNGIDIYINKNTKNILINIYINDNTLPNISNTNRDDIYSSLYSDLTISNFMEMINNIDDRYGYTNYTRYIIIDNDSYEIFGKKYNNLRDLPHILETQSPDEIIMSVKSLNIEAVSINENLLKNVRTLKKSEIRNISELNYYDNKDLAVRITDNKEDKDIIDNYSGLRNINTYSIYRHSGDYQPIFRDIELFERKHDAIGNFIFDTELTDFGNIKELIVSKTNNKDNVLKFKDMDDIKSIYPMIDEFGYTWKDHFLFKSTWDDNYYIKTNK